MALTPPEVKTATLREWQEAIDLASEAHEAGKGATWVSAHAADIAMRNGWEVNTLINTAKTALMLLKGGHNPEDHIPDAVKKGGWEATPAHDVRMDSLSDEEDDDHDVPWIIDRMIPANRLTIFTGQGSVGKTGLAADIGYAMAQSAIEEFQIVMGNDDFVIHPDYRRKSVVMVSYEDPVGGIKRRIKGIANANAADRRIKKRTDPVHPNPWKRISASGQHGHMGIISSLNQVNDMEPIFSAQDRMGREKIGWTHWGESIKKKITGMEPKPSLVIIDNIAASYIGSENDRMQVRSFLNRLSKWADEYQCAILLIGHPPKKEHSYSGSTDWINAPRSHIDAQRIAPFVSNPPGKDESAEDKTIKEIRSKLNAIHHGLFGYLAAKAGIRGAANDAFTLANCIKDAINNRDGGLFVIKCNKLNDAQPGWPIVCERVYDAHGFYMRDIMERFGCAWAERSKPVDPDANAAFSETVKKGTPNPF